MRSASYSFSRVKLSWFWIASACARGDRRGRGLPDDDAPARDASDRQREPRERYTASRSSASSTDARHVALRDVRDFVREHAASSDSFCASRMRPVLTPM